MQIFLIFGVVFLTFFVLIVFNIEQFGAYNRKRNNLRHSKQYDKKNKRFMNDRNYNVTFPYDPEVKLSSSLLRYLFGSNQKPSSNLPEVKPNLADFLQKSSRIKFIWFGHSSFMLNFDGKILLFDPVFSKSASPFSFITKRFQKPVLSLEELPNIDYIILSHDHYDHLDTQTIKFFAKTNTKFLVPLGVETHLQQWGINVDRITQLDWWQAIKYDNLEFILTPAQHFSGRMIIDYKHTLWGSWVIRNTNHSIYFSGDTGYAKHFKDIGDKYGPFDLAFIENGQYDKAWRDVHMLPEDVIQAAIDLKTKIFTPVHWGMFCLAPHKWFAPIEQIYSLAQARNVDIYTPKLGEIIILQQTKTGTWWREMVTQPERQITPT